MTFPNQIIKIGSINPSAIRAIKQRLNDLNLSSLDVSNPLFGPSTEAVVKQFQKSRNLKADGEVGELTWGALFDKINVTEITSNILGERALEVGLTQLHVREKTGHNDGEAVESYLKSVGLGKGYAWCAAFVYWCFNQASKQLSVENPLVKTAGVMDHWRKAKDNIVLSSQKGDIFIMDFGGGKGHTGLVISQTSDRIFTLEGNTNDGGSREGDGVYKRNRNRATIKGYIRY